MRLQHINFGDDFDKNKTITNVNTVSKALDYTDDGLFSIPIFGNLVSQQTYTCRCGKYSGKYYNGKYCEECCTEVTNRESAVERTGWISLGDNYVINNIFFSFLETAIGPKNMRAVIKHDIGYNSISEDNYYGVDKQADNPYAGKGLKYFKEHFIEILDYFSSKDARKTKYANYIKDNLEYVWTNSIPVLSITLRPAIVTDGVMKFDIINRFYVSILKEIKTIENTLSEEMEIVTGPALTRLQYSFNGLCAQVLDTLHGKSGWIRSNMVGVRINFSARNIIIPNGSEYKMNEVTLPYLTFIELYKYELINIIKNLQDITFAEAERVWWKATLKTDKAMYGIMLKMIQDYNVRVLINRNPTINYGSILCCRVAGIKEDFKDQCLGISLLVLPLLAADFDGDVLNIISIKDIETADLFEKIFAPSKMIISNNDYKFNTQLSLDKDHITGIYSLMN